MSYVRNNCDACDCLNVEVPECTNFAFQTELANERIIVRIQDYQNRQWEQLITTDSNGIAIIDVSYFAPGQLIYEAGLFSLKFFREGVAESAGVVRMVGGTYNYYCATLRFMRRRTQKFNYNSPYYLDTDVFICCSKTCEAACEKLEGCLS